MRHEPAAEDGQHMRFLMFLSILRNIVKIVRNNTTGKLNIPLCM